MPTHLVVVSSHWLSAGLVRIDFHSDDLSAFATSRSTDRYVKLVFPAPGVTYPEPFDMAVVRRTLPPEQQPVVRTYTALEPDVEAGTVAIDFVVHGDEGVAGPWAAQAKPGDTLLVNGPGGAYAPSADVDWHLLAGDASALPAITAALAALAALPEGAVARVVLEVDGPEHEVPLDVPEGSTLTWVHRGSGESVLEDAVRGLEWLPGRVQAFVHGEAQAVMHGLRPYLLTERGLDRADVSISGYWRRGRTEEGFRSWKSELAAAETASVA